MTLTGGYTGEKLETDTAYKAVGFIETYTGRAFFPCDPKENDITIIDIAHHLSNQCRYSGATEFFYSTAQHCCILCDYVSEVLKGSPLDCLQILLHDAAEAYLVDMPRPVKQFMPEFRAWDHKIQMCVRKWAGFGDVPIPKWQDEIDSRIITDERAQVMSDSANEWGHDLEPLNIKIEPWLPYEAEQHFLLRYALMSQAVTGKHQYLRSGWGVNMDATHMPFDFRTAGGDTLVTGEQAPIIVDLKEVDLRGGVGRVALRSENGMMIRDTRAGKFPRPSWKWVHGDFKMLAPELVGVV